MSLVDKVMTNVVGVKLSSFREAISDDYGLAGVEVGLHPSTELLDIFVEVVSILDGDHGNIDLNAVGFELLGGALSCLLATAGDQADLILPAAERDGVKGLEQLGIRRDVGRRQRRELRSLDERS